MKDTQIKPEAFFDSLSLAHKLDDILDGFKLEELHLFSYFSSILFLYKGNPITNWGYKFTIDKNGYPFSSDLNSSISRHLQNGLYNKNDSFYVITARGTDEFNKFKNFPMLKKREEYLDAASTTTVLVPYTETVRALLKDPEVKRANNFSGERWIEQTGSYDKFKEISLAVGVPFDDIIISAVTWVNYIVEKEKQ